MASKPPPRHHRVRVENEMIKRREKQSRHEQLWTGRKNYYEEWDKKNTKFDEWTSPRYHETNNKLIESIKNKREHSECLEKRREKLKTLLHEEDQLYKVELMIHRTKNSVYPKPKVDEVPTEVLKELNNGLRLEEEDRRRHEAELKLYHQWRNTNPVLQHYERMQRSRDLKLSWLDQQIENRMKKERDEEECRRLLKERDLRLKEEEAKEAERIKELEAKREELKLALEHQIEDMKKKTRISEDLKRKQEEEETTKTALNAIKSKHIEDLTKKQERECALYNIKQYKMKLKQKAENIQKNLDLEKDLVMKVKELALVERIEDQTKKKEIKDAMETFLLLHEEQRRLEKCRQQHMDFLFDSEAKAQYEQHDEFWKQEESHRAKLMKDVLGSIQVQIDKNLERNTEKQNQIVKEREEMLRKIEEYNEELAKMKTEAERKTSEKLQTYDEQVKLKNVRKKYQENLRLKKIDEELERVRKEEERLKQEIINIQRRQGPIRPPRSKLFL